MKSCFYLGAILLMLVSPSCKKENTTQSLSEGDIELKTNPITGLVVVETSYSMNQLTEDNDPDVQFNNERLAILAQAFQQIACDSSFIELIGQALDDDLECSVEHFLENNPTYKTQVNTWLAANGQNDYDHLLSGVADRPWIYAANYGVHSDETPILALSIELDSVVLGEMDDFIPCYHSADDCGGYQTKLVGLESDLEPEDPALPARALTLVFSNQAEESYNKRERKEIGDISGYNGTVIVPGFPGCEQGDSYEISSVYVTQKFNRSKKVKVAARFVANDFCNNWHNSHDDFGADKIIEGKNILNQVHSTNHDLVICNYATSTCHVKFNDVVGVVFEKDWYSSKWISGSFGSSNCPIRVWERKIKSKNDNEIYAYFGFWADWCSGEIREFNVPLSQDGDHNAYIRIKSTNM